MSLYLITVKMRDGSGARYRGLFASDWDAIATMLETFFDASAVTARRLA